MDTIPMKKGAELTKRVHLAVTEDTKDRWDRLGERGVDCPELVRRFLERELPKVEERTRPKGE